MAHDKKVAKGKTPKKPASTAGTKTKSFETVPVEKWSRYQRKSNMGIQKQ